MDRLLELLAKISTLTADERTELGQLLAADKLTDLSPEDLEKVYDALGAATDAVAGETTPEAIAAVEVLATGFESVTAENTRREEAQAEAEKQRQAALDRINAVRTPTDGTGGDGEPAGDKPADAPATDATDADAAPAGDEPAPTDDKAKEPVSAAATKPPARLGRMAGVQRQAPAVTKPRAASPQAVVAGAGLDAHDVGETFADRNAVAEEFARRTQTFTGGRAVVASIRSEIPEERFLRPGADPMPQVDAVVAAMLAGEDLPGALVAAGFCAPVAPRYDVMNISTAGRPVRDGLVQFGAERGGITFVPPPHLVDLAAAITVWTEAMQDDPEAVKARFDVECDDAVTVTLKAIVARLGIGNLMSRAYPERVAAYVALALAAHARIAELQLLTSIDAASSKRTAGPVLSATRDLLYQAGLAAAGYRKRHRMAVDAPLDVVFAGHLLDELAGDVARQLPGDDKLDEGRAEVGGYLTSKNLRPIWTLDENVAGFPLGPAPGAAATALPNYPATTVWRLFAPGSHLFLDGGRLDLGLVRDSALNDRNEAETFVETFEAHAFVGVESMSVTSTLVPNGTSAGTTAVASVVGV